MKCIALWMEVEKNINEVTQTQGKKNQCSPSCVVPSSKSLDMSM